MLKRVMIFLLLVGCFNLVACGTLSERVGLSEARYGDDRFYPAVKSDWRLLTLQTKKAYDYTPDICYLTIICPVFVILSIPVDFAFDTLLLYGDAY